MIFPRSVLFQLLTLVAVAAVDTAIVDLSQDLMEDTIAMENSPGAAAVVDVASADPLIRAAIVLENGSVVAKYYRDDVDENEPYQGWSVTKSFTSLLVGLLIEEGKLSLTETLGEIFQDDAAWSEVTDGTVDFRKNVTIEEIITHTSGLVTPPRASVAALKEVMPQMSSEMIGASFNASLYDGGVSGGGSSLSNSLAVLSATGTKGEFQIVGTSQILSYVIKERSGMTPREYAASKVLPHLGIAEDKYGWLETKDEVQFAFHGIELTALQMAKFGQLYLQGGQSSAENQVISKSWVDASSKPYSMNTVDSPFFTPDYGYGYLFWVPGPNIYCAFGMLGQDVCIDKSASRVIVQQRDRDPENKDVSKTMNLGVNFFIGDVASDPDTSFAAPLEGASSQEGSSDSPATSLPVPLLLLLLASALTLIL